MNIFVATTMTTILVISGCTHNECDVDDTHCEGRNLVSCEPDSCDDPSCIFGRPGNRRTVEACAHACVKPGISTFCALSNKPDPKCSIDNSSHCDGDAVVECLGGFAIEKTPCAATGRMCVMDGSLDAVCAIDATPNAFCQAHRGTDPKFCDGNDLVSCGLSFVTARTTCAIACVAPEDDQVFCAAASEPDPRCTTFPGPRACPDGSPATCTLGFLECLQAPTDEDAGT
jgi:hypothetical protein